jgi:hypothetical protein
MLSLWKTFGFIPKVIMARMAYRRILGFAIFGDTEHDRMLAILKSFGSKKHYFY